MPDGPTREQWVDGLQWELYGGDDHHPGISIVNPNLATICDFYREHGENDFLPTQVAYLDADKHSRLAVMAPKLWLGLKEATDVLDDFRGVSQLSSLGLSTLVDTLRVLLDEAVPPFSEKQSEDLES